MPTRKIFQLNSKVLLVQIQELLQLDHYTVPVKRQKRLIQVKLGGGKAKIEKQHAKGKMTARERIDYLLDPKSKSIEICAFAVAH